MKNERLFDALGGVSPDYVTEAATTIISTSRRRPRRFHKGMIAVAAAMIALITLTVGLTISAEEEPALEEVPVIMLKEDFERLVVAEQEKQLGKNKNSEAWHRAERTKAFYEYWDLSSCRTENAKTALLKRYPVTECCVIYALDATATDEEKEFILGQLRSIGFSQLDLIEAYENLYRAVEESDSPNKETILATLPDIPPRPASEEE
ncbi:MAG: hypothetical protein E7625_04450 [Ruminococcaceae bacterium]|nr:hypothetical protein [Oscillospiraceae bacterium]